MAKYKDKWKTTFPASIGNQTRPEDGVDNTQEYNTDGLPQYMANDPVRYDLQNAVNSKLVSNDERLNEKIKRTSDDLAAHNKDPKAHVTGIAGNAATASKLITPRTISLTGKAAGATTFDGSSNASINVTSVNADTASKLSTARKINITGNASGSAGFDGTSDVSINVTVNSATKAVNDGNGANIANTYVKKAGDTTTGKITFASTDLNALPEVKKTSDDNMSGIRFSSKTKFLGAVGKCLSNGEDLLNLRSDNNTTDVVLDSRNYNNYAPTKTGGGASGTWGINISGNAVNDGNGDNIANTYLKKATVIDVIYPVGSIYMSMSATNPATLFGVGTWTRISQGRMLLGADDSTYKAGATGGEATHTLTAAEMPAHSHTGTTSTNGEHTHGVRDADYHDGYGNSFDSGDWGPRRYIQTTTAGNHNHTFTTDNSGGGAAHNNMPPYLVCYIWQRTA